MLLFFFFQAEDGIRDKLVTGVQTCALPISEDEQFGVLADAVSEGLVRLVGLSEVGIEEIERARRVVPIVSVQNRYNVRSEERRVGKECRSRGAPDHQKKKSRMHRHNTR